MLPGRVGVQVSHFEVQVSGLEGPVGFPKGLVFLQG